MGIHYQAPRFYQPDTVAMLLVNLLRPCVYFLFLLAYAHAALSLNLQDLKLLQDGVGLGKRNLTEPQWLGVKAQICGTLVEIPTFVKNLALILNDFKRLNALKGSEAYGKALEDFYAENIGSLIADGSYVPFTHFLATRRRLIDLQGRFKDMEDQKIFKAFKNLDVLKGADILWPLDDSDQEGSEILQNLRGSLRDLLLSFNKFIEEKEVGSLEDDLAAVIEDLELGNHEAIANRASEWLDSTIKAVETYASVIMTALDSFAKKKGINTFFLIHQWQEASGKGLLTRTSLANGKISQEQMLEGIKNLQYFFPDNSSVHRYLKDGAYRNAENSMKDVVREIEGFGFFSEEFQVALNEVQYRSWEGLTRKTYRFKLNHSVYPVIKFLESTSGHYRLEGGKTENESPKDLFDEIFKLHDQVPGNADVGIASLFYLYNMPDGQRKEIIDNNLGRCLELISKSLAACEALSPKFKNHAADFQMVHAESDAGADSNVISEKFGIFFKNLEPLLLAPAYGMHIRPDWVHTELLTGITKGRMQAGTLEQMFCFLYLPNIDEYIQQEQDNMKNIDDDKESSEKEREAALQGVLGRLNHVVETFDIEGTFFDNFNPEGAGTLEKINFILQELPNHKQNWEKCGTETGAPSNPLLLFYYRYLYHMLQDFIDLLEAKIAEGIAEGIAEDIEDIKLLLFTVAHVNQNKSIKKWGVAESVIKWSKVLSTCRFIANKFSTLKGFPNLYFGYVQKEMQREAERFLEKLNKLAGPREIQGQNKSLQDRDKFEEQLISWLRFLVRWQGNKTGNKDLVEYIGKTKVTGAPVRKFLDPEEIRAKWVEKIKE